MSNFSCAVRTNYFRVKDEAKFRKLMSRVISENSVELWDDMTDENGNRLFGFGSFGSIYGIQEEDGDYDEDSFDLFARELMNCVSDDDAVILYEAGHEKLRYVGGVAYVITSKEIFVLNLTAEACKNARRILGNEAWSTQSTY